MSFRFQRPIGAAADVKELEYIAALHQTDHSNDDEWTNASIDAADVKHFLMSRYGIKTDRDQIRKTVLYGLGGGDSEDDIIDLTELVAILLIPMFLKVAERHGEDGGGSIGRSSRHRDSFLTSWEYEHHLKTEQELNEYAPPPAIIHDVLRTILLDCTNSTEPPKLTKCLLRTIFATYDEIGLVQDEELMEEMIQVATGGDNPDAVLDAEAFARALTDDVKLYDTEKEMNFSTHFDDVFGADGKKDPQRNNGDDEEEEWHEHLDKKADGEQWHENGSDDIEDPKNKNQQKPVKAQRVSFIRTLPAIDFTAETFRSKTHVIIVWVSAVIGYYNYFYHTTRTHDVCEKDNFGCQIAQSVYTWTAIMLVLSIVGSIYVTILSSGNTIFRPSIFEILIGMAGVALCFFVPFFVHFDAVFFMTETPYEGDRVWTDQSMRIFHLLLGSFLFILQICNLIRICLPSNVLQNNKRVAAFFTGSNTKAEFQIKRACVFKINQMVKNAYQLHKDDPSKKSFRCSNESEKSSHATALLNFTRINEKTEPFGGFFWAWKGYWSGSMKDKEGIWIHSRIIAGNVAQFAMTIFLLFGVSYLASVILKEYYGDDTVSDCTSSFDPTSCYYPNLVGETAHIGIAVCTNVKFQGDGCANMASTWLESEIEVFEPACDYLDQGLIELLGEDNIFVKEGTFSCPKLYQPDGTIWSRATGSTEDDYCDATVTTCFEGSTVNGHTTGYCVLGQRGLLPFRWEGDRCDDIPEITNLWNDRQASVAVAEDTLVPDKWMVQLSFAFGILASFLVGMLLTSIYIPSTVSTILQFRSGVIPSLRDPSFKKYRASLEGVSYLIGIIFWGVFFSAFISFFLVGGGVFLIVWQATRPVVITIIGMIIGICITLGFKSIVIFCLGRHNYAAFYRKRPIVANIAGLALECWHLGISSGYMIARTGKLIFVTALYVGRIDRPFLADGAGNLFGTELDNFPIIYRKDLLSADAHRHPYIERLGVMYMMKLRYGENFGKTSGSIWRLLFVFALMPWLRKYRILGDLDVPEDALLHQLALKSAEQESSKGGGGGGNGGTDQAEIDMLRKENEQLKMQLMKLQQHKEDEDFVEAVEEQHSKDEDYVEAVEEAEDAVCL